MQISLKCLNCGAALSIPEGVDQMACGYCGVEQIVQREGGGVWLSLEKAIGEVKATADRTAAELQLRRLIEDHDRLATKRDELQAESADAGFRAVNGAIMAAVVVIIAGGIALIAARVLLSGIFAHEDVGTVVTLFIFVSLGLMILMAIVGVMRNRSQKEGASTASLELDDQIAMLEREMEASRRKANGEK